MIYADNSATTQLRPEAREAMLPYLQDSFGNPSSLHEQGQIAHDALAIARESLANLLNCESSEIYFTANGTLSNNLALLGRARFAEANNQGKHLITTAIEHSSVLGPSKYLQSIGWEVTYLPVNNEGIVDINKLSQAIKSETSIVSIGWVNNEIGSIQPIEELAPMAQRRSIFFHTDAVQAIGKLAVDLASVPVSALTISAHKFNGPKGIAALFIRNQQPVLPITFGGGQEQGLFGTESIANIVGMGVAADLAKKELFDTETLLVQLQKHLLERLSSISGIQFTGSIDLNKRLPGHVSLVAPGRSGESLVLRCDLHGICLSSGSACHGKSIEPSHVLKAIGLSNEEAQGSLRISLGRYNNKEECDEIAAVLENVLRLDENAIQVTMTGSS